MQKVFMEFDPNPTAGCTIIEVYVGWTQSIESVTVFGQVTGAICRPTFDS
jgi:hypothetical protein